jgi:hypothetical protein
VPNLHGVGACPHTVEAQRQAVVAMRWPALPQRCGVRLQLEGDCGGRCAPRGRR